jgi:hypothetical protein
LETPETFVTVADADFPFFPLSFFFSWSFLFPINSSATINKTKTKQKKAEPDVKTLETMRKFSEQFAKR